MAGTSFDVIVIGVGSMGSAACYHLARRGARVLGLEQFSIVHERGSHNGQSRIIRMAYGESPQYVPLLKRAYENWKNLEGETRTRIYFRTGLVYFGEPESPFLQTVLESSARFGIPVNHLGPGERARRYPQFCLPDQFMVLEEPDAGFLLPETCIGLLAGEARRHGARLHPHEVVVDWRLTPQGVAVTTDRGSYTARKLVVAAGPWAGRLLPGLSGSLQVTRQVLAWGQPENEAGFSPGGFPCWMYEAGGKCYYGFPMSAGGGDGGPAGLKAAVHFPGEEVSDPDGVDRSIRPADLADLTAFMDRYLPGAWGGIPDTKVCLYTNSPDGDFILDFLPGHGRKVVVGCGFSGHGFKFASAVGEVLADLALDGKTALPIGFLQAGRFG